MYYLGVDVGGTFTDIALMDEAGKVRMFKTGSTPGDPAAGILEGIKLAGESAGLPLRKFLEECRYLGHGTTVATNSLLERKGAKVGLITTKGFGDSIFIQRTAGPHLGISEEGLRHYAAQSVAAPLVPRALVREVTERVDYKGAEVIPLNEAEVRKAVRELAGEGVEAIAVCFLWSFMNPAHEERVAKIIAEEAPKAAVNISSRIMPVIKEYERAVTTIANAFLYPSIHLYIADLVKRLKESNFQGALSLMNAAGGVTMPGEAEEKSVFLIGSGPAGGLASSAYLAEFIGCKDIIATDMGGTSFDAGLIAGGKARLCSVKVVGRDLLHVPMLDIESIGSGGGSIARVEAGTLKVGPRSAGADPGPACYGRGGTEPTVTDADVVLGFIDPDYFLGGRMKLDKSKAERAIEEKIARPLGLDVVHAAAGIKRVLDSQAAGLLTSLTIKKGYDPRDFVLLAYGGAGPAHCSVYGAELGVKSIVVPFPAAVNSAFGVMVSDLQHVYEFSDPMRTPPFFDLASKHVDHERINRNFEKLETAAKDTLRREAIREKDMALERSVDMRYRRQVNELAVPVPAGKLSSGDVDELARRFDSAYEAAYGRGSGFREAGIEITLFRVRGVGKMAKPALTEHKIASQDASEAGIGERRAYFLEVEDFLPAKIYDGLKLKAGHLIEGPAIVQQPGTTVVIGPDQKCSVDPWLNLIIERKVRL